MDIKIIGNGIIEWLENNWKFIFFIVLFVAFTVFMIINTWPQSQPNLQDVLDKIKGQTPTSQGKHIVKQETTSDNTVPVFDAWGRINSSSATIKNVSTTTTTSDIPESYVISKEDLDKALTTVAYTARKEAQSEYKDNFSILLTILTIFGIAWPVIVGLLNFKFNEKELDKISETQDNVTKAITTANTASEKATDACNTANDASQSATNAYEKAIKANAAAEDALKEAKEANKNANISIESSKRAKEQVDSVLKELNSTQAAQYYVFSQQYYDMGCDQKKICVDHYGTYNYYFAHALEFKLRALAAEKRNIMGAAADYIINAFYTKDPSSEANLVARNILTTCNALAEQLVIDTKETVRNQEARSIYCKVRNLCFTMGCPPTDGKDDLGPRAG